MSLLKIKDNIEDLNKDVRSYINAKFEYLELRILRKSAKETTKLILFILISFFAIIVVTLLSFAVAFLIGEKFNSVSLGFFIVAGFYLFIMLILILFGKHIFRPKVIQVISTEITNFKEVISEIFKS